MAPSPPCVLTTCGWHFMDMFGRPLRPPGFDPTTASQVSRPVAIRPKNLKSAFPLFDQLEAERDS